MFGDDWWDGVLGDVAVVLSKVGLFSLTNANYSAALVDVGEVKARCREEYCVFGCEFGGGVGCGRDLKAFDIYVLFNRE